MIFQNFKIAASPFIHDAYCGCGKRLEQVSNGLFSVALFCPHCENVYIPKLIKLPEKKVTKEFLEQCREETKSTAVKSNGK
jgi:hypothetical protein